MKDRVLPVSEETKRRFQEALRQVTSNKSKEEVEHNKENAIKILKEEKAIIRDNRQWAVDLAIKFLEQAPIFLEDETLVIDSEEYFRVKRVLVQHKLWGTLFYPDED